MKIALKGMNFSWFLPVCHSVLTIENFLSNSEGNFRFMLHWSFRHFSSLERIFISQSLKVLQSQCMTDKVSHNIKFIFHSQKKELKRYSLRKFNEENLLKKNLFWQSLDELNIQWNLSNATGGKNKKRAKKNSNFFSS
jgi:hypothetical protein